MDLPPPNPTSILEDILLGLSPSLFPSYHGDSGSVEMGYPLSLPALEVLPTAGLQKETWLVLPCPSAQLETAVYRLMPGLAGTWRDRGEL